MTEQSRRLFLRAAAAGALTGGAILLPGGPAEAADAYGRPYRRPHHDHHDHHDHHGRPGHHHRPGGSQPPGTPPPGSGESVYSLTARNNSSEFMDFVVYQTLGGSGPDVFSLAWLTAPAAPGGQAFFQWNLDLEFVFGQTGNLQPGVVFLTQQSLPADPTNTDDREARLSFPQSGFTFTLVQGAGSPNGDLSIVQDSSVPVGQVSVGIGMSGAPTTVTQAGPNLTSVFAPNPTYWVAAGNFEAGQVLDVHEIGNPAQLAFGGGTDLTATLDPDGQWSIAPS